MDKKIKVLLGILIIVFIFVISSYVYFINYQAKNGSILIERGSFTDFLIFDKAGIKYYNHQTGDFEK